MTAAIKQKRDPSGCCPKNVKQQLRRTPKIDELSASTTKQAKSNGKQRSGAGSAPAALTFALLAPLPPYRAHHTQLIVRHHDERPRGRCQASCCSPLPLSLPACYELQSIVSDAGSQAQRVSVGRVPVELTGIDGDRRFGETAANRDHPRTGRLISVHCYMACVITSGQHVQIYACMFPYALFRTYVSLTMKACTIVDRCSGNPGQLSPPPNLELRSEIAYSAMSDVSK